MFACALAIVLLTDVSSSVNQERFDLQRAGIARAFRDPNVIALIEDAPGGVAFNYVQFAYDAEENGWVVVKTAGEAEAYAQRIEGTPRYQAQWGSTGIISAVSFSLETMTRQPCEEPRKRVIDVAADGMDNVTADENWQGVHERASAMGVQINALAILGDPRAGDLTGYMREHVASPDGFVMEAQSHADVGTVFRRKLAREMALR